jgi:AcrR family transcriptional regulator
MARRTGRRPGRQDTRAGILAAARELFAERGYDGASIRSIAAEAAVDPALVHHYFRTKEQLFLAVVQPPVEVAEIFPKLFGGEIDGLGERLVRTFLTAWEGPVSGPAFHSLLRSAVSHPMTGRLVREFFTTQVVRRAQRALADEVDPAEIPTRASLVASQMFGLALARYIVKFEPLAGMPLEAVVASVAPSVQRYLTAPLDLVGRPAPDAAGAASPEGDRP